MMASRGARRVAAVGAILVGTSDLGLAAAARTHLRVESIVVEWAYEVVVGARYLLLIAGIVLVLSARGLLHGKRNAWRIALAAGIGSIIGHHVKGADGIGLAICGLFVIGLLTTRHSFVARADPRLARYGWRIFGLGECVVFVYGVVGLYALDEEFRDNTTLLQSVREAARLLVLLPARSIDPVTRHGAWFIESVRVAALAVVLVALTRVVSSVAGGNFVQGDRALVTQLLEEWADTSLASFHLLDDKLWFLGQDRQAFISYTVVGTTAVALGEPVGAPASCDRVAAEFLDLCAENGWIVGFHQVTPRGAMLYGRHGLRSLKIGEEAVVPVQEWDLQARHNKSLRSALRRIERAGLVTVELPRPLSQNHLAQLREVSDGWMADGGHRERTFTLGQYSDDYMQRSAVLALVDPAEDRIIAFTNIVPSFRADIGNFDLMRRRPDAPNGAMDALFVALIDRFRAAGMQWMTLGMVPFVRAGGDTLADRAVGLLYERGDAAFNAQGLFAFKDKWKPHWEPRYLVYQRDTDLPRLAAAVVRAGELPDPRSPLTRVRRVLRRFPFSTSLIGVVTWLMTVTAIDNDSFRPLLRNIGLRWNDLLHLQLWRLPTSQLIQDRPGFVWSIVALCFVAAPLAEWRAGTWRSVLTFFLCDWVSTLTVLAGARILADSPTGAAARHLAERDAGSSSGGWGLAILVACSIPRVRPRVTVVGLMFGFLLWTLVAHQRIFDVQHVLSASTAVGLAMWWSRQRDPAPPVEVVEASAEVVQP